MPITIGPISVSRNRISVGSISLCRDHLTGYMNRWFIKTKYGGLRLHHILRSDADRHLHDHPWDFTSFILWGEYWEELPIAQPDEPYFGDSFNGVSPYPGASVWPKHWPRWSVVRRKATDAHLLRLSRPVWTLVWHGPNERKWGFWTEEGWVYWRDYAGAQNMMKPEFNSTT
jgi:hypothetical protein